MGTQGRMEAEKGGGSQATLPLGPPGGGSSPSVLLPSVKSWLCMIFSTMSSASIRVSSTQVGWLSIESFFRRNERSDRCGGRGGRGGFSGGRCSRSPPSGPSTVMLRPPEALLLVDVLRRWVKSERLEERECSVL